MFISSTLDCRWCDFVCISTIVKCRFVVRLVRVMLFVAYCSFMSFYHFGVIFFSASLFVLFFFFKQKTAYEMRISYWSSDVCSSDLRADMVEQAALRER